MTNMVNMANTKDGKRLTTAVRVNRFVVMLTDAEIQAIEDYQFTNRVASKGEAARQLIKDGLKGK